MMFDSNKFKVAVKTWMRDNPEGSLLDLQDFCESQIPSAQYAANQWLVEHTLSWYKHVLTNREINKTGLSEDEDDMAS